MIAPLFGRLTFRFRRTPLVACRPASSGYLPTSWALDVAALSDGSAAVATLRHGLLRVTAAGAVTPLAAPDPWLLHVSLDADGQALWVGGQGGALRLATPDAAPMRALGLPDPNVHAVFTRNGEVWIGTEGGTLVVTHVHGLARTSGL